MRDYSPGNPLIFSHIPKTAGTSLTAALVQALQPGVFVQGMDQSLAGGYDDFDAFAPKARESMFLAPEELPADATLVAGHIGPATTRARYPEADHVTFLREPRSRILSQWMHSRALSEFDIRHWGPGAEAFRVGWLPLRDYLRHPLVATNTDNTITRFLVWPLPGIPNDDFIDPADDDRIIEAALGVLGSFAHVGVVEADTFMEDFERWLGRSLPRVRLNERAHVAKRKQPDFAAELDAETLALLDERTRLDRRLWLHVAERTFPDDRDLSAVLEDAFQSTIRRYRKLFEIRAPFRPVRRGAELAYEVAHRLRR